MRVRLAGVTLAQLVIFNGAGQWHELRAARHRHQKVLCYWVRNDSLIQVYERVAVS